MKKKDPASKSFNYRITKLFLSNNRLTILTFILLLLVGMVSTLFLKTTGFPNAEIKLAVIVAVYPGASSETVLKDVTVPLEGAVKSIDGVSNYTSTSSNNVSQISVTIDDKASADSVRNKLDSAVKNVTLPSGVETPKVITPSLSGADINFSLISPTNDLAKLYETYVGVKKTLTQIPETASVEMVQPLKAKVSVKLDNNKLFGLGINIDDISTQLRFIGETLPVISDATLDNQSKTLTTSVTGSTIEDIRNIDIKSKNGLIKLKDVAEINLAYYYPENAVSYFGYNKNGKGNSFSSVTFDVKASKGTDLAAYMKTVEEKLHAIESIKYSQAKEIPESFDKVLLVESYAQNDDNQDQVHEVISGLIGGDLKTEGPVKHLGWLLGGIQLVFLVMLAFVSWRAALVASAAIPLSLMFSTIFVYFTGNSLNTLVLFSLVLVIGLVVDPALVILESIQRKIDAGLKGRAAALAAVKDVGNGLFLAALTNVIVFAPFGLISGVLGQIFSYIPLTIIPAIIGSYIVPLVFLAWIGSIFLKPGKNKAEDEEENMWKVAKWLQNINYKILTGSVALRIVIITVAFMVPLGIAGYYFGSGQVKQVQFASSDDGHFLTFAGEFLPTISKEEKDSITKDIIAIVSNQKSVANVYRYTGDGLSYFAILKDKNDREGKKGKDIAAEINKQVLDKYNNKFFDFTADVIQTGPPESTYQVSVGIKTDDLKKLESSAKEVATTLRNVCQKEQAITIDEKCDGGKKIVTKVDDGYTNRENKVIEVLLDRNKLTQYELTIANAPLSALVNAQIKSLFQIEDGKKVGSVNINGEDIEIILDKATPAPKTLQEIKDLVIFSTQGQQVKLSDAATISEKTPKSSIQRVKGQTVGSVQARLEKGHDDQAIAAMVTKAVKDYYGEDKGKRSVALGLEKDAIAEYSEGGSAGFAKSFTELSIALLFAIVLTYIVLALFFQSFTQPIVILFTIPLTFIGIFPALAIFVGGQFGFLEIIGLIILVGIVENVAIFLIDAAKQKIREGWEEKKAIAYASAIRLRPVLLTKFTAIASLMPLAIFSEFYRSIAVLIMAGLITSGFTSLFTTPILYIYFRFLSREFQSYTWIGKSVFLTLTVGLPVLSIVLSAVGVLGGIGSVSFLLIPATLIGVAIYAKRKAKKQI